MIELKERCCYKCFNLIRESELIKKCKIKGWKLILWDKEIPEEYFEYAKDCPNYNE